MVKHVAEKKLFIKALKAAYFLFSFSQIDLKKEYEKNLKNPVVKRIHSAICKYEDVLERILDELIQDDIISDEEYDKILDEVDRELDMLLKEVK